MTAALYGFTMSSAVDAANAVRLRVDRLEHPQVRADGFDLSIDPARDSTPASLRLHAKSLRIEGLAKTLRDVRFDCEPVHVDGQGESVLASGSVATPAVASDPNAAPDGTSTRTSSTSESTAVPSRSAVGAGDVVPTLPVRWRCDGPLRWQGGDKNWSLVWEADEGLTMAVIRLKQGNGEITLQLPLGDRALAVALRRAPVAWLEPVAPQLRWQAGRIDGRVEMTTTRAGSTRWRGELRARSLSAEGAGGSIALAGVDIGGAVDVTQTADGELRIDSAPTLTVGELLAGPVYVAWPAGSAMVMHVSAVIAGGEWRFERFYVDDGGFQVDARSTLMPADTVWLRSLQADVDIDLSSRYERYVEGAMASIGQAGLGAGGLVEAKVTLGAGGTVDALDSTLTGVTLRHPDGRYAIAGMAGSVGFRRGEGEPAVTDLRWQSLRMHTLDFGAGEFKARSHGGEIRATQPVRLRLFGGDVTTRDLVYRPLSADGDRLQASVDVAGIDIAGMTTAFGWPAFTGRLEGRFPQLRYAGDVLGVGGEIAISAFGGTTRVAGLSVERPFGVAPALSAEMAFDNLDLQPLTEVFGLGRIEGRLNGTIAGLRLLDWRPTAFDARLRTVESGRRRISQLAVDQLTQIGGGGGAGGIQGRLLGVFDSFGYRRIGLSCRLANDVCEMGGVDESAGGYTILQGSGLPLITIRGFQKRVDWPVLVDRLEAVIAGQKPVVD
jgi:hypothetical protein